MSPYSEITTLDNMAPRDTVRTCKPLPTALLEIFISPETEESKMR